LPLALALLCAVIPGSTQTAKRSWAADNGSGTYSTPLFYDEFSDPDMIRVGDDYYLTGTTMHTMPGLPILHSRDLVNWRIIAYAFDRLDLVRTSAWKTGRAYTAAASGRRASATTMERSTYSQT